MRRFLDSYSQTVRI